MIDDPKGRWFPPLGETSENYSALQVNASNSTHAPSWYSPFCHLETLSNKTGIKPVS
jgi:hypothetical protein